MSNYNHSKFSKRLMKVYRGHYLIGYSRSLKAHPVIRMGGIYLSHLGFQVGDAIEVSTEQGRITITKVKTESV